jgi:hypothetical protein
VTKFSTIGEKSYGSPIKKKRNNELVVKNAELGIAKKVTQV